MENMITFEQLFAKLESKVEMSSISFKSTIELFESGKFDLSAASRMIEKDANELLATIRFCYFHLHAIDKDQFDMLCARVKCLRDDAHKAVFYTTK